MNLTYSQYLEMKEYLATRVDIRPEIGIILGSCLGDFASLLESPTVVPYGDIPNFLTTTVSSHAGKLIFGKLSGKNVVCMSGRFHTYEGYDFQQLTLPIRLFHVLGVQTAILTNASGAVNETYRPGDVMVIADHIKLGGHSPLRGANIPEFGERFFDTTQMYTPSLQKIALDLGANSGLTVHNGVYMFFSGPQFETPAEIRAARILGADAIGMSTVTEALTAAHCKMPLLGLAVITNMAAGVLSQPLTIDEVDETAQKIAQNFGTYVREIVGKI